MLVVVIEEDESGQVDVGRAHVDELDPIAGLAAGRLDLVDAHGHAAVVRRTLGGRLGDLELAGAVSAAAVRRRGVPFPRVRVDLRATRIEEADLVGGAEVNSGVSCVRQLDPVARLTARRLDLVEGDRPVGRGRLGCDGHSHQHRPYGDGGGGDRDGATASTHANSSGATG
ncbi:MAG: hypothetical protein ACTH31_16455 [Pseudoclavibacter sp.]